MRAALGGGDGVDERDDVRLEPFDPTQCNVDRALALDHLHLAIDGHLLFERVDARKADDVSDLAPFADEVVDQVLQAAAAHELHRILFRTGALVFEGDAKAWHEEAGKLHPANNFVPIDFGFGVEDVGVGPEANAGARLLGLGDLLELVALLEFRASEMTRNPLVEVECPSGTLAVDFGLEFLRQRIDYRSANTMKAARRGVCAATKLAARVQLGKHDLECRYLALRVLVDRNAAAVVGHFNRAVSVEGDEDLVGLARSGFVDRVVDELPHQVHEPGRPGATDVHARTFANRFEPFEGLDGSGVVIRSGGVSHCCCTHRSSVQSPAGGAGGQDDAIGWSAHEISFGFLEIERNRVGCRL